MEKIALYGNGALTKRIVFYNNHYKIFKIIAIIDDDSSDIQSPEIPIMNFAEFKEKYKPESELKILITVGYAHCNTIREKLFKKVLNSGYSFANYISPRSICWVDLSKSYNIIVFDNVFIGPGCKIGSGVVICPGTHLSHDVTVGDFCFFSDSVAVGGNAYINKNTFIGLNSTIKNSTIIGEFNIVASAANVVHSSASKSVLKGNPAMATVKDTLNVKI